ncbi:MAG: hypothetical protein R3F59_04035 [Myxococcota bacterium]
MPDADGDGLRDEDELAAGLDPADPDSDGDGVLDGVDPSPADAGGALVAAPDPQVGCDTGGRASGALGLLLAAALVRRRRR